MLCIPELYLIILGGMPGGGPGGKRTCIRGGKPGGGPGGSIGGRPGGGPGGIRPAGPRYGIGGGTPTGKPLNINYIKNTDLSKDK